MAAATLYSPYYKEELTHNYLSKTFESSVHHAPGDTKRRTASLENYLRQRHGELEQFKTPWGRKYSYGGIGVVNLPIDHRPKGEPPLRMQKGTSHYGAGACVNPGGVTVQQLYSLTPAKKAYNRSTDELIQSPNKVDLTKQQIQSKYLTKHPYSSHIESADIFPSFGSFPDYRAQNKKEKTAATCHPDLINEPPLGAEQPAAPYDVTLIGKARGTFGRHEVLKIPLNTQRKPMTWTGGPSYRQIVKGANKEKQVYYPTPTKLINQSTSGLSERTLKALKDLHLSRWETTYQKAFDKATPVKYINLDSEDTLKLITSGPNARVPRSLMTDAFNPGDESRTVEEISGETEKQKRLVHFENLNTPNEDNLQNSIEVKKNSESGEHEKSFTKPVITFPKPAWKQIRPFTSRMTTNPLDNNQTIDRSVKSAQARSVNKYDVNTVQQNWSRSDCARKFNTSYYNDEYSDLHDRQTTSGRRHYIPEAGNIRSCVFN